LWDFYFFPKVPTSQYYHYSPPFLQDYYKISILLSSFSQLPRLVILFLLKKLVGTSILKIQLKIMSREERSFNDPSSPFQGKEKEGEGRSKAWRSMEGEEEGSHVWWPMEGEGEGEGSHAWRPMESSKLGGQWKVKEKSFSPLLTFPLTKFT
jgi:hypothetical protein